MFCPDLHLILKAESWRSERALSFSPKGSFFCTAFFKAQRSTLCTGAGVHVHAPCGNKRGVFVCPRAGQTVLNVSPASGRMTTGVFLTRSPADCRVTGSGFGHFEPPVDGQKNKNKTQTQKQDKRLISVLFCMHERMDFMTMSRLFC